MSQYTYALSLYFSNGLSLDLLNSTISTTTGLTSWLSTSIANGEITFTFSATIVEATLISVLSSHVPNQVPFYLSYQNTGNWTSGNLLSYLVSYNAISLALDTYALIGFNPIPTVSTITTAITNYVEPAAISQVTVLKSASQNYITTSLGDTLTSQNPQEIIVSQIGRGQYTTVSAAVASIGVGSTVIIRVFPGTYVESNPISIPTGCSLKAAGSAVNTIIVGINSSSPVFETGAGNLIDSITIVGGSYGISHNGSNVSSFTLVQNTIFSNSTVLVSNGYGSLLLSKVIMSYTSTNNTSFVGVTINGGSLVANDTEIIATTTSYGNTGILALNNALVTIDVVSVYYFTEAIAIKNNTVVKSTLVNIESCGSGCVVLPNDSGYTTLLSRYCFGTLNIENSTTYDLNIQTNANLQYLSAQFDDSKIYNPNNVVINANIQNYRNTVNRQIISGTILVGTESIPSTISIGHNINSNNMLCFLFDGTNYVDESANFRLPAEPPVTITNQSLYICHQSAIIYGFDIYTTLSTNPTLTYWNGTAWVTLSTSIYDIVNYGFVSQMPSSNAASLYFDGTYAPQQVSVNSVTAYWIQVTLANCTITSTTLHSNVRITDNTGTLRKYGSARVYKQMNLPPSIVSGQIYFLPTANFDYSTPYSLTVYADSGFTLNGQLFNTTSGSVSLYATSQALQSVSLTATNVKSVTVLYLSI